MALLSTTLHSLASAACPESVYSASQQGQSVLPHGLRWLSGEVCPRRHEILFVEFVRLTNMTSIHVRRFMMGLNPCLPEDSFKLTSNLPRRGNVPALGDGPTEDCGDATTDDIPCDACVTWAGDGAAERQAPFCPNEWLLTNHLTKKNLYRYQKQAESVLWKR